MTQIINPGPSGITLRSGGIKPKPPIECHKCRKSDKVVLFDVPSNLLLILQCNSCKTQWNQERPEED